MCVANRSPGEEAGQTGERKEPREDGASLLCLVDVSNQTQGKGKGDHVDRTALLVNLGSDLGTHSLLTECLNGTARSVGARVCDRNDGERDDGIEDGRQDFDSSKAERLDEG